MSAMILYIEDNDDNAKLVEIILKREGYSVIIARDASLGIQYAIDHQPKLIICDYHLPGHIKGPQVIQTIRDTIHIAHTPILMLTADTSTYPESMASGADAYLNKPVSRDKLLQSVHMLLGKI